MKSKLYILLLFMLLLPTIGHAAQSPPCAVYIIIDPSWSCEHKLDDFRSLTRQISISLKSGDYMEILSAGTTNPKVCLAQYIGLNPRSEFHEIQSALKDINTSMFYDASISRAVSTSIARSKRLANQNFNPKVIFVFTDGKLKPTDSQQMKALYSTLDHENIELYLTGKQSSDRELLIAGNQEKLHFFLIHEANPAQWLKKRRPVIKEEPVIPVDKIPTVKQTALSESETDFEIKHRFELEALLTRKSHTEPAATEEKSAIDSAPIVKETKAADPNIAAEVPAEEPAIPAADPKTDISAKTKKPFPWLWVVLGAALLLSAAGLFFLLNLKDVQKWNKARQKKQRTSASANSSTLVAKVQGRTYPLGKPELIRKIHIGSGPKTSLRIDNKAVSPQHLRVYRKQGGLMLKNIGTSEIKLHGTTVKPGAKHRLVLPAEIQFSPDVQLNLKLINPKPVSSEERSVQDGNPKEN